MFSGSKSTKQPLTAFKRVFGAACFRSSVFSEQRARVALWHCAFGAARARAWRCAIGAMRFRNCVLLEHGALGAPCSRAAWLRSRMLALQRDFELACSRARTSMQRASGVAFSRQRIFGVAGFRWSVRTWPRAFGAARSWRSVHSGRRVGVAACSRSCVLAWQRASE